MKFITSIITHIHALVSSIAQPPAPVAATTAPHIRMLLLHLCNQDAEQVIWVARWLAYPLRHPGAKMRTALLVDGADSAGSLFFEKIIGPMYGNQAQLGGVLPRRTFNGWAIGKRYAVITELRPMTLVDVAISNSLNLVLMMANDQDENADHTHQDLIQSNIVREYNRRIATLEPQHLLPAVLSEAVLHEVENGGLIDFHQYLTQELEMGDFDQYTSPYKAMENEMAA